MAETGKMDDRINVALGILFATADQIDRAGEGQGSPELSPEVTSESSSEFSTDGRTAPSEVLEGAVGVVRPTATHSPTARPRLLITRRRKGTVYAGYWEFPGGKVEPGETIEACLVREFQEEVGLLIRVERPLASVEHDYAHGRVRLHPFYCHLVSGRVRNLEVADHRWVDIAELGGFAFPEANLAIVDRIRADWV